MRLSQMWRSPAGRGFIMLAVMSATFGFALNAHGGIVTNFFEEVLKLKGPEFGYVTAIREVGGFLLIFMTAVLYKVSLQRLTAGALILLAVGYILYGFANSFVMVIPWVVITSFGFHTVLQTQYSLGMSLTTESKSGSILGRMAAIGQGGTFAGLALMFLIFHFHLVSYRTTFIILGLVALIGAFAIVRFPHMHEGQERKVPPKRERIVWKRDYRYYYVLNILDGARQQVFFSFGLWVLVNRFSMSVSQISLLLLGVAFVSMVASSWVGRRIDKHGEKLTISLINVAYVGALIGFALVGNLWAASLFYLIYALIAPISTIAATTYVRKIAMPEDVAPTLAMGVTLLHATAIVVPVAAGYVLNFVGYQVPFYVACIFAVAAIAVTRGLDPVKQKSAERIAADLAKAAGAAPVPESVGLSAAGDAAQAAALRMATDGGAGEEIAGQAAVRSIRDRSE
jgi:predicted MFS family arabinose efflux permease